MATRPGRALIALALTISIFPAAAAERTPAVAPTVALVRGTFTESQDPAGEGPAAARAADLVGECLARAGVPFEAMGDEDVAAGALAGFRLAVLPYNPRLAEGQREALGRFLGAGGRLIVFYTADRSLWPELGIASARMRPRTRRGEFAQMRFSRHEPGMGGGLQFLPAAIQQDSWTVVEVEPGRGAEALARWHDDAGQPSGGDGPPAVILGAGGAYVSHILLGRPSEAKARLMMALAVELAGPAALEPVARAKLASARRLPEWQGLAGLDRLARSLVDARADRERLSRSRGEAARAEREAEAALEVGAFAEAYRQAERAESRARTASALALPARDGEIRAVWVRFPERVDWRSVAPRLSAAGFNVVLPNYIRGARAMYPSAVLAGSEPGGHGGLAACLRECRAVGIEVHVWWTTLFTDDTPEAEVARLEAEGRLVVDDRGRTFRRGASSWLCPTKPANLAFLRGAAAELLAEHAVDGIHLDYARLPSERACFCEECRREFGGGEDWPAEALPGGRRAAEYRAFRRSSVLGAVEAVRGAVDRAGGPVSLSAAVYPELATCRESLGQDWLAWVEAGAIDWLAPMNYTYSLDELAGWIRDQAGRLEGRVPLVPGIGLSAGRVAIDDTAELVGQIASAREAGADGYAIFQLDAELLGKHLGLLAEGPGRSGALIRPHGAPALTWRIGRRDVDADARIKLGLDVGRATPTGRPVEAFGIPDAGPPRIELEDAFGSLLADVGPGPGPGESAELSFTAPEGPFRLAVRGRVTVGGRERLVVARSPLMVGVSEEERRAGRARVEPIGRGPRVAVVEGGYGSRGMLVALRRDGRFASYPAGSIADAVAGGPRAIVLTQRRDPNELGEREAELLRAFVAEGGGVLLTHDAVGYRYHRAVFPEVAAGKEHPRANELTLARALGEGRLVHAHYDQVALEPAEGATVLASGERGAVIAAKRVGRGTVVSCGVALGIDALEREYAPDGAEGAMLIELVRIAAEGLAR